MRRAAPLTCERWRAASDPPFGAGAKGAIWCGEPAARIRQLALYTFVDAERLAAYWPDRLERIIPRPAATDNACANGVAGTRTWASGQIVCYVDDGVAKIRWTDDRSRMYGVVDAVDANLRRLYRWWRTTGRGFGDTGGPAVEPPGASPAVTAAPEAAFACVDSEVLTDPLDRSWTITDVAFEGSGEHDRVTFRLALQGPGATNASSVQVSLRTSGDPQLLIDAGVDPPEGGDTAVIVTFGPGIRDETALFHVAPAGVQVVRDASTHRTSGDGSIAVLGATGDGCYRMSVPAFEQPDASDRSAEVILDIQP